MKSAAYADLITVAQSKTAIAPAQSAAASKSAAWSEIMITAQSKTAIIPAQSKEQTMSAACADTIAVQSKTAIITALFIPALLMAQTMVQSAIMFPAKLPMNLQAARLHIS